MLPARADDPRARDERGFTLIEMMTVLILIGIISAAAVASFEGYARSQDQNGTAQRILSSLRNTAERAQSEGRTYCVSLDSPTSWSIWRYSCDPTDPDYAPSSVVKVESDRVQGSAVMSAVSFAAWTGNVQDTNPCPAPAIGCIDFSLRTTASPGSLTVTRPGSSAHYIVTVVGLTGNSYVSH